MISKLYALYLKVNEYRQSSPATTERLFLIKVPNARLYDDMRRMLIWCGYLSSCIKSGHILVLFYVSCDTKIQRVCLFAGDSFIIKQLTEWYMLTRISETVGILYSSQLISCVILLTIAFLNVNVEVCKVDNVSEFIVITI